MALYAEPLILYERGGHTRRLVDDWLLAAGVEPRPVIELGSVEAIKQLVGAGLGCAVLPAMALQREQRRAALVCRAPWRRHCGAPSRSSCAATSRWRAASGR